MSSFLSSIFECRDCGHQYALDRYKAIRTNARCYNCGGMFDEVGVLPSRSSLFDAKRKGKSIQLQTFSDSPKTHRESREKPSDIEHRIAQHKARIERELKVCSGSSCSS